MPLINAGGDRLVVAAMLGLGLPIRAEIDRLGESRTRRRGAECYQKDAEKSTDQVVHRAARVPESTKRASVVGGRNGVERTAIASTSPILYCSAKATRRGGARPLSRVRG